MVATNFDRSLKYLLVDEGGNDDDPADHGGRTSRGVTQREYSAWRIEQGLRPRDVWSATDAEVRQIYHEEYWEPHGDLFPPGIDYMYFDMAVNAGPSRATKLLQQALGVVADGRLGPITRNAVRLANPRNLLEKFSQAKRDFYIGLHQPRFTRGWLNRVDHVRANALQLMGTNLGVA